MHLGRWHAVLALFAIALLVGCKQPVGAACEISGSGFSASDPCASQCLSRWSVNCPDGTSLMPNVCAGKKDCAPGGCPEGQACYSFDDPFEARSYCIPDTACGSVPSADERLRWEQHSATTAAKLRAEYAARNALRTEQAAPTAVPVEPPPRVTE